MKQIKKNQEMLELPESWIEAMIKREALPPELRTGTNAEFCQKWEIGESTYYYQASKKENQDKIVSLALLYAKKHTSEVLENLGVRAKSDNKAAELFIKFILQLAEKTETDITSKGEKVVDAKFGDLIQEFEKKLKEKLSNEA